MLVYRGFAVQDEKRTYHPGPAMGAGPAERGWTREFTDRCRPHLEALAAMCGETVNLVIRTGTQVRFLASVESDAMLRVGDRQGQVLPAELVSGGRSLLAELPDDMLQRLYLKTPGDDELDATDRRLGPAEFDEFRRELTGVRRAGFAVNVEQTEEGVAAFGRQHPQPRRAADRRDHGRGPHHPLSAPRPRTAGRADEARGAGDGGRRRRHRTIVLQRRIFCRCEPRQT